jgi:hypothetical protein
MGGKPLPDQGPRVGRRSRLVSVLMALGVLVTSAPTAQALAPLDLSVEKYYLTLMNCTRTGGTVQSNGTCKDYGSGKNGGYRAPFKLSKKVSDLASRPYSKLIVLRRACSHWTDGHDPSYRLRRIGINYSQWGENVGCRDGSSARKSVLASHLNFQSERSSNGWHWRNIKNPALKYVGIGLWKVGTTIRFTVDFYTPRS